jgi:hypothetical protein
MTIDPKDVFDNKILQYTLTSKTENREEVHIHTSVSTRTDRWTFRFLWNRRTKYLISYINSSWQSWALFSLTKGKIDGLCLNALSSKLIFYLCNRSFYWEEHLSNLTFPIIQYHNIRHILYAWFENMLKLRLYW